MNSLPRPSDIVARKRDERRRAQQSKEAEEIYTWLVVQRGRVRDLIHASVKHIGDPQEAADVRLDLYVIARCLTAAAGPESTNAIWRNYKEHFVNNRNREEFFIKLRRLTRRVGSSVLINYQKPKPVRNRAKKRSANPALQWDSSLLPENIASSVLRLAILHPGVLEYFLPRFFCRASDCTMRGSTYRRALFILEAVPELGWSAEKHTKRLVELGEIRPSKYGSEVETVKKFIRDLRRRYKKKLSLTQQPEPVQGTSSAPKAAA